LDDYKNSHIFVVKDCFVPLSGTRNDGQVILIEERVKDCFVALLFAMTD